MFKIKAYRTHKDYVMDTHITEYKIESWELASNIVHHLREAGRHVVVNRGSITSKYYLPRNKNL